MGKGKIIVPLALVIAAIIILAAVGVGRGPLAISGYDGIDATVSGIEHNYGTESPLAAQETIGVTTATLDFVSIQGDAFTPTGVRAELSQPQYIGEETEYFGELSHVDKVAKTNVTETWEVHIIKMTFSVTFKTTGAGLGPITGVTFWFELEENPYSVFTAADDAIAFIIEVYTTDPASINNLQLNDVEPAGGGKTIVTTTVETADIPDWILNSGYTGELTNFKRVKFPLKIIKMQPTNVALIRQVEGQVTVWLGVDVLLFGHWNVISPYREDIPPDLPDIPDLLGDLIAFLMQTAWIIGGFVIMVAVLYIAPGRWKAIGPVIFVAFLLYGLGFFDVFLEQLGIQSTTR